MQEYKNRLTMSTNTLKNINTEDWITQAEAARIRKVSRQAINKLVRENRLRVVDFGGVVLVNKSDVENFEAKSSGRPKKS
ncbi:MAG: helix-turn-helix domain-containing protein [Cyclobacteriaceae bacterium]|jgi:excisionase family DNA binding protein|nr:helix-turn-helix domain-containing protein [Cyclobacteriaceae bacterium]